MKSTFYLSIPKKTFHGHVLLITNSPQDQLAKPNGTRFELRMVNIVRKSISLTLLLQKEWYHRLFSLEIWDNFYDDFDIKK